MIDLGTILNGLLAGGLYAVVGLGLSLAFGVMRLVNLAHGELMILGAYASAMVIGFTGMDPLLSLVIVAPVMFCLAYPVQRYVFSPLLARGQEPPLVATFGVSLLISAGLVLGFGGDSRSLASGYGSAGVNLMGVTVRVTGLITIAMAIVLIVGMHLLTKKTQWGAALRAAASDPTTASTMGINVANLYGLTFAISAVFAAIAGVLVGVGYSFTPTTGASYLLIGFTVVVLGGAGNVLGTLWGGLAIGMVQSIGSSLFGGQYRDFVVYAVFILILVLGPGVLALRRRIAQRKPLPELSEETAR